MEVINDAEVYRFCHSMTSLINSLSLKSILIWFLRRSQNLLWKLIYFAIGGGKGEGECAAWNI